jgi:hypothetical protein
MLVREHASRDRRHRFPTFLPRRYIKPVILLVASISFVIQVCSHDYSLPKSVINDLYRGTGFSGIRPESRAWHGLENGFIVFEPEISEHPILQLIERGQAAWNDKVSKQSKTLKQAVDEYRRRYDREPPKGFNHWWEYIM